MKLEALYNAVIVKPMEAEETSYGGIIVPDLGNEKNKLATVVSGPENQVLGKLVEETGDEEMES